MWNWMLLDDMEKKSQFGVILLAIALTAVGVAMIVNAGGIFLQDGSKATEQEQAGQIVTQNFTAKNHTIHSAEILRTSILSSPVSTSLEEYLPPSVNTSSSNQ